MWYDEIAMSFQNLDTILGSITHTINPSAPLNRINMKREALLFLFLWDPKWNIYKQPTRSYVPMGTQNQPHFLPNPPPLCAVDIRTVLDVL